MVCHDSLDKKTLNLLYNLDLACMTYDTQSFYWHAKTNTLYCETSYYDPSSKTIKTEFAPYYQGGSALQNLENLKVHLRDYCNGDFPDAEYISKSAFQKILGAAEYQRIIAKATIQIVER